MVEKEFEDIINKRLSRVKTLLIEKGKEYTRDGNPFHNFERGADMTGDKPPIILDGFLLKHLISYRDMLDDFKFDRKPPSETLIKEKFGDIITYFCIQEALFLKQIKPTEL